MTEPAAPLALTHIHVSREREIVRLLVHSWADIGYDYNGLTEEERKHISPETFRFVMDRAVDYGFVKHEDLPDPDVNEGIELDGYGHGTLVK